jgi:hypothetical protein
LLQESTKLIGCERKILVRKKLLVNNPAGILERYSLEGELCRGVTLHDRIERGLAE